MITVSIIIPTAGCRHELLHRAVRSAIIENKDIKTEVLVILNGEQGMKFDISKAYQHPFVSYHKINEGNVSKARNFGLSIASGGLIRFLDDDDYLIKEVAYLQYIELFQSKAELSTYSGDIRDDYKTYQKVVPVYPMDYYTAVLSSKCPALTFATVYKSSLIKNLMWDENLSFMEDENWMRSIAYKKITSWITSHDVVGVWYQHQYGRLSISIGCNDFYKYRALSILKLVDHLQKNNIFNESRQKSAALGLWSAAHGGFPFDPIYWIKISKIARNFDINSHPEIELFRKLYFLNPILLECLLIPLRKINRLSKILKNKIFGSPFLRSI